MVVQVSSDGSVTITSPPAPQPPQGTLTIRGKSTDHQTEFTVATLFSAIVGGIFGGPAGALVGGSAGAGTLTECFGAIK